MSDLTLKQQAFINAYLETMNGVEAAKRAGYKGAYTTLGSVANENLKKPKIKAEIERRMEVLTMPSAEVLKRLTDMARGDMTRYIAEDGSIDIDAMKADGVGYLLKKYKKTKRTTRSKFGNETDTEFTEVELYPADGALDKLMRYHSLYNDKMQMSMDKELLDLFRTLPPTDRKALATLFPDMSLPREGIEA